MGETLRLTINSMNERTGNNKVYAYANMSTSKKSMQQIFLASKQSIMRKIPLPKIEHDNNLSVITPNELVENVLMLGINFKLIRASHADEDISKFKNMCF